MKVWVLSDYDGVVAVYARKEAAREDIVERCRTEHCYRLDDHSPGGSDCYTWGWLEEFEVNP